jgi:hypothetical protein
MSDTLRAKLPAIYGPLLPDFFDRPAIEERRATCDDCAMCNKGAATVKPELVASFFRPDIKCCSYHPTVPNYLIGAVLADPAPDLEEGRRRIREKIARRIGVTPFWLAAPRKFLVLLEAARLSSFGRSESLLCPYYERSSGLCTIWRHRESVCGTFFCKHEHGAASHAFWTALKEYLTHIESSLARYAALSVSMNVMNPDLPRLALTLEDLEDRPPADATYAEYWGDWVGREEAFYIEANRHIRELPHSEFVRVVDETGGKELLAKLTALYEATTSPKLAKRLALNNDMRVVPAEGGVAVTSYSRFDSLFLSNDLYDALKQFSPDEPSLDVIARLARERDLELPEELLLQMQLHAVVVPAPEPDPAKK